MLLKIYLSKEDHQVFQERFKNCIYRSKSEYGRKLLLGKPVVTIYRNRSLDDFIEMGSGLRRELRRLFTVGTISHQEKEDLNKKITSIEENLIKLVDICKLTSGGKEMS